MQVSNWVSPHHSIKRNWTNKSELSCFLCRVAILNNRCLSCEFRSLQDKLVLKQNIKALDSGQPCWHLKLGLNFRRVVVISVVWHVNNILLSLSLLCTMCTSRITKFFPDLILRFYLSFLNCRNPNQCMPTNGKGNWRW